MKLIFMDFDRTIIEEDSIDKMKNILIKNKDCEKIWEDFELQWKKNEITNYECLLNQFLLYDFENYNELKQINEQLTPINGIDFFFKNYIQEHLKYNFFILSDNFYFIIGEVLQKFLDRIQFAYLGTNCNFITKDSITDFLRKEQTKSIKIFANFITSKNNYIRPILIYRNLCKKHLQASEVLCKKELKNLIIELKIGCQNI